MPDQIRKVVQSAHLLVIIEQIKSRRPLERGRHPLSEKLHIEEIEHFIT
jgi:hypothetical protein